MIFQDIQKLTLREWVQQHEVFCPYEVSKLLKQAGFNWECKAYYDYNKNTILCKNSSKYPTYFQNSTYNDSEIACPSIDIAVYWLRNEKHISIQMIHSNVKSEWASCVNEKYYWANSYYYALAEGLIQGLKEILHLECLKIKFV